ncbi:MAG: precorrin-6y C5,15-methyltransferase (decarboxylating) subunit CbiE [Alphaproteobacteria bacterium]|nr:precorrin-6y C5,15-methyltransferase (decarboxylating) subunit CbiE [Alphaproteobacteria bacterium]
MKTSRTGSKITIVGIGEAGLVGLKPAARALIENAKVLVGGARHLAMIPESRALRIEWTDLSATLEAIEAHADEDLVVLASGDPMWFGLGATLAKRFGPERLFVVPTPGAFSLAAARLGWPLQETLCLTVHGRPLENILLHLAPGQKLLVLGEDTFTPMKIADLLRSYGFKSSRITILSNLGGPRERIAQGVQAGLGLDVIAIECIADNAAAALSRAPGLPDEAYEHDGQITKRDIRAATLARLSPLPGQTLWDIGAGAGSVAIEFLRAVSSAKAVAFEKNPERAARIGRNALAQGVPALEIVTGSAPEVLQNREERPDAVFVGGGVSIPGLLECAWKVLNPGGRLVANAATIEGEASLLAWQKAEGGDLVRLSVDHLESVGAFKVWKPAIPVVQYCKVKT